MLIYRINIGEVETSIRDSGIDINSVQDIYLLKYPYSPVNKEVIYYRTDEHYYFLLDEIGRYKLYITHNNGDILSVSRDIDINYVFNIICDGSLSGENIFVISTSGGGGGSITGSVTGSTTGSLTGSVTGSITGSVTGSTTGSLTGSLTGEGNIIPNSVQVDIFEWEYSPQIPYYYNPQQTFPPLLQKMQYDEISGHLKYLYLVLKDDELMRKYQPYKVDKKPNFPKYTWYLERFGMYDLHGIVYKLKYNKTIPVIVQEDIIFKDNLVI